MSSLLNALTPNKEPPKSPSDYDTAVTSLSRSNTRESQTGEAKIEVTAPPVATNIQRDTYVSTQTAGDTTHTGKSAEETTEELKSEAGDVKEGAAQTATGIQGAYEKGKAAGQDERQAAKGKGKEAASQAMAMAGNLVAAGKHTLQSLAESAGAAKTETGKVTEGAKKTGSGVRGMAKTGAGRAQSAATTTTHALARPLKWTYNKTTGALSNATTRQPNERVSPWWGVAAIAAGTVGFALATAASWGATLFITLPALAAGTATLGGLFLAQKLVRRLWNGAPTLAAGSDQAGMSPIGRDVHNTCVTANTTLEGGEKALLARQAAEKKKIKTIHSSLDGLKVELAQHRTALQEIASGLNIIKARKFSPMTPFVMEEAKVFASEDTDVVTEAIVEPRMSGTVQGEESKAAPAVHAAEVAGASQTQTTVTQAEGSTSTAKVKDLEVGEVAA